MYEVFIEGGWLSRSAAGVHSEFTSDASSRFNAEYLNQVPKLRINIRLIRNGLRNLHSNSFTEAFAQPMNCDLKGAFTDTKRVCSSGLRQRGHFTRQPWLERIKKNTFPFGLKIRGHTIQGP